MAKLVKEKFDITGNYKAERTTFRGQVEAYLYYETSKDYFYFEIKELEKYFEAINIPKIQSVNFSHCKTREKAIEVVKILFNELSTRTRMIRIDLGMPQHVYMINNPEYDENKDVRFKERYIEDKELPSYLSAMLSRGSMRGENGISLSFTRVIKIESNGHTLFCDCDKNWKESSHLSGYGFNLIEWSQEKEDFLLSMQKQMDEMCKRVLDFFNAKSLEEFCARMTGTANVLKEKN